MSRAVFLDRDGTINEDRGYVHLIEEFQLLPGALEALQLLSRHNIRNYIVTNQSGIGRGLYSERDFHQLTGHMLRRFAHADIRIEAVLFCPHHPQAALAQYRAVCACRKPATGLLQQVIDEHGYATEHLAVIGDKNSDIEAGRRLGVRTYLVETGFGRAERAATTAHFVMPDLQAAVKHLLSDWGLTH